jgi:hypothetical protein
VFCEVIEYSDNRFPIPYGPEVRRMALSQ